MAWILDHLGLVFIVGMGIASWFTARKKKAAEALRESQRGGGESSSTPRQTYQQPPRVRELQDPRATVVGSDDHTRRIQEQIRRKIAERRGEYVGTERSGDRVDGRVGDWANERSQGQRQVRPPAMPTAVPPPMYPSSAPTLARKREQELSPYATDARREEEERATAVILARQRALEEQMAELNARKAAAKGDAKAVWSSLPTVDVSSNVTGAGSRSSAGVAAGAAGIAGGRGDHVLLGELRQAQSLRKAVVLREVLGTPVGLR